MPNTTHHTAQQALHHKHNHPAPETTQPPQHPSDSPNPKAWITIAELQDRFKIGRTSAYKWAGQLPPDVCMRIGSKKLLINERKLISYLEKKGRQNVLR